MVVEGAATSHVCGRCLASLPISAVRQRRVYVLIAANELQFCGPIQRKSVQREWKPVFERQSVPRAQSETRNTWKPLCIEAVSIRDASNGWCLTRQTPPPVPIDTSALRGARTSNMLKLSS